MNSGSHPVVGVQIFSEPRFSVGSVEQVAHGVDRSPILNLNIILEYLYVLKSQILLNKHFVQK